MAEKKLTCKQAQARIGKYLTGDEMPAEQVIELEAHVLDCKVCGKVIEDKRNALMSMLNTTEEPEEEDAESEEASSPEPEPELEPAVEEQGGLSAEELELLSQITSMETIHDDTPEPEAEPEPVAAANTSDVLLSAEDLELLNQIEASEPIVDDTPEPDQEALTADDLAFLESIETSAPAAEILPEPAPEPEPEPTQESQEFVQISEHVDTDIPELDFSDLDNFVPASVQEEAEQQAAAATEEHDEEEDTHKAGVNQLIERFPILVRDNFKLFAMSGALGLVLITMGVFVKNPTSLLGPKAMSSKQEVQKDEKKDEEDTSDDSGTKSSQKKHSEEDTSDTEEPKKKAHDESEPEPVKKPEPVKESTHEKPTKEAHKDNIFDSHKADAHEEKPVKLPDDNNADYLTARSNGGVTHTTVKNGKAVKTKPATKPTPKPAAKPAVKPKPTPKPKPVPKPRTHVAVHKPKPVVHRAPIHKPKPAPKKHVAAKPAKHKGGIKIYDEGGHEIR